MKKNVLEYSLIIVSALLLGFLIIKGAEYFRHPISTAEGDFHEYISKSPIVIYSTSWCPKCKNTVKYFKKRNIIFEERDIEKNSQWKSDFIALKASGIPVVVMSDRVIFGYNLELFDKYIFSD